MHQIQSICKLSNEQELRIYKTSSWFLWRQQRWNVNICEEQVH